MLRNYFKPTPKLFRMIGDSVLVLSTMFTIYGIAAQIQWLALTALLLGVFGKFLMNFFTENK